MDNPDTAAAPKTSLYSLYKTDAKREHEGVWLVFGESKFLCARSGGGNRRYAPSMAKHAKPYRRIFEANQHTPSEITVELLRKVQMQVFAEAVVLDWENVPDADGNEQPFSKDAALKLFTDLPEFFDSLMKETAEAGYFRAADAEADAKN